MSLLSRLLGSSDPSDYAGRESASTRAARKATKRAKKDRAASAARHRQQATDVQRRAFDRGWR